MATTMKLGACVKHATSCLVSNNVRRSQTSIFMLNCAPLLIANQRNINTNTNVTDVSNLKPALKRRLNGGIPRYSNRGRRFNSKEKFDRRTFGRFGFASRVDPSMLWPKEDYIKMELAKQEFQVPLSERIVQMKEKQRQEQLELQKHQEFVASRMAKMDQYIEQYHARMEKQANQEAEKLKKREALLEEAREFFGYEVTYKDAKFQQMMEWKEEQEKLARKAKKKQSKQNYLAAKIEKLTSQYSQPQDS